MAINTFSTSLSNLNHELRFSVKHSFYSIRLKEILAKRAFFPLKSVLKSQPQYGANLPGRDFETGDELRYIRITDIDRYGNLLDDEIKSADIENEERYLLKDNDFLFARSGNTVGKSFLYNSTKHDKAIYAGYFIRFEINFENIDPKFFLYYTKTQIFDTWKNSIIRVMGQPNINAEEYKLLPIPQIDKKTQLKAAKQIAAIEDVITDLKKQIIEPLAIINKHFSKEFKYSNSLWKEFGKGMTAGTQKSNVRSLSFFSMPLSQIHRSDIFRCSSRFHNPVTQKLMDILAAYPTIKVADVLTEKVKRGVQPQAEVDGRVYAIKTAQLKNGYIDLSECEMVSNEFYENNQRAQLRQGDIVITSTGKVSLGKIDLVEFEEEAIADTHVSIVRIDESKYNKLFFIYFFRSILGAFQIERDYTGATNQIDLYTNQIEIFLIPDIPSSKQEKIVEEIKKELDAQNVIEKQIDQKELEISNIIEQAINLNDN
jgi:type I restriction enzyme S subunit